MKKIQFVTPTRLSLINLTTIGDSEKKEDESKIGKFSSGQAYATALLLRNGVKISITTHGGEDTIWIDEDNYLEEKYTEYFNYDTVNRVCETTDKEKEVIRINYEKCYHGHNGCALTQREPKQGISETIETAFALQLGYNWSLWMSLRELYSNMIDEGGYWVEDSPEEDPDYGTVVTLEFDESNPFNDIWENKGLYINTSDPLFVLSESCEALENKEGYLRIYKQNILVYEDKEKKSKYAWNIKFGEIDERRILSNLYQVEQDIITQINSTKNREFLETIITNDFSVEQGEFLSYYGYSWSGNSDLIHDICFEVYTKYGDVKSYPWLIEKVKKRKDCKIGGKIITTVEDSLWSYSTQVRVETSPEVIYTPLTPDECILPSTELSFASEIKKYYNFNLDVEVKTATLKNSKAVADKYENCIIIDENFDIKEDFYTFVVEYIDLTRKGNVVENLSKYICEILKTKQ